MTRKYFIAGTLLTVATSAALLAAYGRLPSTVPTHWSLAGYPNGYSPKWTLFLTGPGLMTSLMLLFALLPWLSPQRWEVNSFRSTTLYIMLIVLSMVAGAEGMTLWVGLGHRVSVGRVAIGGLCVAFGLMGNVLGKVRRNFYIGVRTPWSLASERVWIATHRMGAKSLVLCAVLGILLTALGADSRLVFGVLMLGVFAPAAYSLILYKQLERAGQL